MSTTLQAMCKPYYGSSSRGLHCECYLHHLARSQISAAHMQPLLQHAYAHISMLTYESVYCLRGKWPLLLPLTSRSFMQSPGEASEKLDVDVP